MTLDEDHPGMFHAAIEMSLVPIVLADPHQHDDGPPGTHRGDVRRRGPRPIGGRLLCEQLPGQDSNLEKQDQNLL